MRRKGILGKTLSVLMASAMAVSYGSVAVPAMALEPQTSMVSQTEQKTARTITIAGSEHGKASVDGKSHASGDAVKLTLAPDQGYKAKSYSVTGADGKLLFSSDAPEGNEATFTMPDQDVTVSAVFEQSEINPQRADAKLTEASDDTTTAYIKKNLNSGMLNRTDEKSKSETKKEGNVTDAGDARDGLQPVAHRLLLNYDLVDRTEVESKGLKSIHEIHEKDSSMALIAAFREPVQMYEVKGKDVLVAMIDPSKMTNVAEVRDANFTNTDTAHPTIYNDRIQYDMNTGIVYVPKSLYIDKDGKETTFDLNAELMALYDLGTTKSQQVIVETESNDEKVRTANVGKVSADIMDTYVTIPLASADTAKNVDMHLVDIYINDETAPVKLTTDNYFYDEKTGNFSLSIAPVTVYKMKAVIKKDTANFIEKGIRKLKGTFNTVFAANTPSIKSADDMNVMPVTLTVDHLENLVEGAYYHQNNVHLYYFSNWGKAKNAVNADIRKNGDPKGFDQEQMLKYNYNTVEDDQAKDMYKAIQTDPTLNLEKVFSIGNLWNRAKDNDYNSEHDTLFNFAMQRPSGNVTFTSTAKGKSATVNFDASQWPYNYMTLHCADKVVGGLPKPKADGHGEGANYGAQSIWRVVKVTNDYAVFGVIGSQLTTQSGYGFFKFKLGKANGKVKVKKASGQSWTGSYGDKFSLAGAQYGVYKDQAATQLAATLTTGADGYSNEFDLPAGRYYIKEIRSSKGFTFDGVVHAADIKAGETTTVNSSEPPAYATLDMTLQKYDRSRKKYLNQSGATGNGTLGGAEFTLTGDDGKSYAFVTANNGTLAFSKDSYAKDTKNRLPEMDGKAVLPIGSYTLTETKAPFGYMLPTGNDAVVGTFTVKADGSATGAGVYDAKSGNAETSLTIANRKIVTSINDLPQNVYGALIIQKADADEKGTNDVTKAQGNATFEGTQFRVINRSTNKLTGEQQPVLIPSTENFAGYGEEVATLTAGKDGKTPKLEGLQFGTYEVTEIKAGNGYTSKAGLRNSAISFTFTIDDKNTDVSFTADKNQLRVFNTPVRGSLKIKKNNATVKSDADTVKAEGDASLRSAEFQVINRSSSHIYFDANGDGKYTADERRNPGEVVTTMKTDENGNASLRADALPYGDYEVKETKAPEGYILSSGNKKTFSITSEGQVVDFTYDAKDIDRSFYNQPYRGGFSMTKRDSESRKNTALGGASLNATYRLINRSRSYAWVDVNRNGSYEANEKFAPGAVIMTFTTDAHTGKYSSPEKMLPYGTYEIDEVHAPAGYMKLNAAKKYSETFTIRRDGQHDEVSSEAFYDYVKRGDVYLQKKMSGTAKKIANIPFRITALDQDGKAIESHIIFTDENGVINTSNDYAKHTYRTNQGDNAYDAKTEKVTDKAKSAGHAGTWFGVGTKPADSLRLNATGALPFGTYRIEELRCDANRDLNMYSDVFTVGSEEATDITPEIDPEDAGITGKDTAKIDFGTVYNYRIKIITSASDIDNGSRYTMADNDVVIKDAVEYDNVPEGTYTMRSSLYDTETKKPVNGRDGKPAVAEKQFTSKDNGKVEMTFDVLDASALAGKTIVVYEDVIDSTGRVIAQHRDPLDENQQIHFPSVGTTATDGTTSDHLAKADANGRITDKVAYRNLEPGRKYRMKTYLMEKGTASAIKDKDGKEITAEKTFRADKSGNGTETAEITYDASGMAGKSAVIFEEIYLNDEIIAEHKDINDELQTVHYPKIGTTAKDSRTKDHISYAGKDVTIIDTVKYENVIPGREYRLYGTLYDAQTKQILTDASGKAVKAQQTIVPQAADGTADVTFRLDGSKLAGRTTVAFESLTFSRTDGNEKKEYEIADHEDIADEKQMVHFPKIGTTATDKDTKIHLAANSKTATIVDEVRYENVIPGRKYSLSGVLMDKATGKAVTGAVKAEFTADKASGKQNVNFVIDTTAIEGKTFVAFEELYISDVIIADHKDINDVDQSIEIMKIRTEATDSKTKIDLAEKSKQAKIIDRVKYEHLIPGKEYTLSGELYDKATGKSIGVKASRKFTAPQASGYADVEFAVDTTKFAGKTLVAFETASYNGIEIGIHADINDEQQDIHVPEIGTTAADAATKIHQAAYGQKTRITDTVAYRNVVPGKEYTIKGRLMSRETGDEVAKSEEVKFTPAAADGTVDISFVVDTTALEGQTLVVFENLYYSGIEVAGHEDISDENQSVHVAKVRTTASHDSTKDNVGSSVLKEGVIHDEVRMNNLIPGTKYTVKGRLVDSELNTISEASLDFTAEKADETRTLDFKVDGTALKGKSLVAFEKLFYGGVEIARHENPDDENQTVHFPDVGTELKDDGTKAHVTTKGKKVKVTDTVAYRNLIPGKEYTLKGVLVEKVKDEKGNYTGKETETKGERTFTPETPDGKTEIVFTIDSSELEGKTYVAFETLYHNDVEVAVHADISDEDQTVHVPKIGTTANDKTTGMKNTAYGEKTTIIDEVAYENLVPGLEYTIKGELMDKATGKSIGVKAEKKFTPEKSEGKETIEFVVDTTKLEGKSLVAFEEIYLNGSLVGDHKDINDEGQTVLVPELHTTLTDEKNKTHSPTLGKEIKVIDKVTYKNLIPGTEYTIKGELMDKSTGKSTGVKAESKFKAEKAEGTVDVVFTIDTTKLAGKSLVAFERLYYAETEIGRHEDITDTEQTVNVPEIGTTAKIDGKKSATASGKMTVTDEVRYSNLTPGQKYTVEGVLMDKSTNKPVVVDGKEIHASKEFTPEKETGSVTLSFTFSGKELGGRGIVAFEELKAGGTVTAEHKDITDRDQTVDIQKDKKTGDSTSMATWIAASAVALAMIAFVLIRRKTAR